jgi:hypothetical protein
MVAAAKVGPSIVNVLDLSHDKSRVALTEVHRSYLSECDSSEFD